MSSSSLLLVAITAAVCFLLALAPHQVLGEDDCSHGLTRVSSREEVVANFKHLAANYFVGQEDAYDATLAALSGFRAKDVLILHYVGASGTGKTLLANLVQRSFFHLKQCPGPRLLGVCLNPVSKHAGLSLHLVGTNTCGVAYADFLNVGEEENYLERKRLLVDTVQRALIRDKDSVSPTPATTIILLDNFNLCKRECEEQFSRMITTRALLHETRLENIVFLITSDLSQEGLRLIPGEGRQIAQSRVLRVVEDTWGTDSLWNDLAHVVPFAPYSDNDLVKIFDMTVREVEREIRLNLEEALELERLKLQRSSLKWTGRFKFSDRDRTALLDSLHREIASRNARAFEKLKAKFIAATRRPVPIERVLIDEHEPSEAGTWSFGELLPALTAKFVHQKQRGLTGLEFRQDIVFRAAGDTRLVVLEVDDIHAFYQKDRREL